MKRQIVLASAVALSFYLSATARAAEVPDVNPFSGDAAAIKKGQSDYRSICSVCHGGKADGAGERASSARTPADLRKFYKGFRKFVEIVSNGVQAPGRELKDMPAWGGVIDDDTIYRIGAYLETLGLEGTNWKEGRGN